MTNNFVAIIPARGGSKRLKNKNLRLVAGKSLVQRTIETAKKSKYLKKIILSSDKEKILDIGRNLNIDILKRSKKLSSDYAKTADVVMDVLKKISNKKKYKYFILLQPTSPLRNQQDINKSIEIFLKKKALSLISVVSVDKKFLKSFILTRNKYLKPINNKGYAFYPTQNLPNLYLSNGAIYIVNINYFKNKKEFYSKKTVYYEMTKENSLDIDTLKNFKKVSKKLLNQK